MVGGFGFGVLLGDDEGVEAPSTGGPGMDDVADILRIRRQALDHQEGGAGRDGVL